MNYLDITVIAGTEAKEELGLVTIFDNYQIKEQINDYKWINEHARLAMDLHLKEIEVNKIIEANDIEEAKSFIKWNKNNPYLTELINKVKFII